MCDTGLDEENAFRRLQELARGQSRKPVEVARSILVPDASFNSAGTQQPQ
jgi:AmiR/NasT family two-component response regulator